MSRAAIILTTIFTAILPFSSLSLAASDAEIESFGDKMSAAFECSTYAHLSQDQKEQQRLFQIGLKAGRDYVERLKSRDDLARGEMRHLYEVCQQTLWSARCTSPCRHMHMMKL